MGRFPRVQKAPELAATRKITVSKGNAGFPASPEKTEYLAGVAGRRCPPPGVSVPVPSPPHTEQGSSVSPTRCQGNERAQRVKDIAASAPDGPLGGKPAATTRGRSSSPRWHETQASCLQPARTHCHVRGPPSSSSPSGDGGLLSPRAGSPAGPLSDPRPTETAVLRAKSRGDLLCTIDN